MEILVSATQIQKNPSYQENMRLHFLSFQIKPADCTFSLGRRVAGDQLRMLTQGFASVTISA